jgi:hypothetical protein
MLTRTLLRWSNWPIPNPSDDLLGVTKPASFTTARIAADSLALGFLWGIGLILGLILMILLGAVGQTQSDELRRTGGNIGLFIATTSLVGFVLHLIRYLIARSGSLAIENQYFHEHLRTSGQAQAMGTTIEMVRRPALEALTRPRDLDLLLQVVLGFLIFQSQRF